jgi:hypothetical protein
VELRQSPYPRSSWRAGSYRGASFAFAPLKHAPASGGGQASTKVDSCRCRGGGTDRRRLAAEAAAGVSGLRAGTPSGFNSRVRHRSVPHPETDPEYGPADHSQCGGCRSPRAVTYMPPPKANPSNAASPTFTASSSPEPPTKNSTTPAMIPPTTLTGPGCDRSLSLIRSAYSVIGPDRETDPLPENLRSGVRRCRSPDLAP